MAKLMIRKKPTVAMPTPPIIMMSKKSSNYNIIAKYRKTSNDCEVNLDFQQSIRDIPLIVRNSRKMSTVVTYHRNLRNSVDLVRFN